MGEMTMAKAQSDATRVWFRLIRLHTRIRVAIADRLKAIGISVPQCDVLTTLTEEEGLNQQVLAERLYVTKGNISGLLDRLADAGLVERRVITGDKRSFAVFLTPTGREIARQGIEIQNEFIQATFGQLTPGSLAEFENYLIKSRNLVRAAGIPAVQDAATPSKVAV